MKQDIIKTLKIVAVAVVLTIGANYLYAWTGPTAPPTGGNVPAPINVGGLVTDPAQVKTGNLNVNGAMIVGGIRSLTNGIFDGTIQIKGGTPALGKVLTSSDENGNASWQVPVPVQPAVGESNLVVGTYLKMERETYIDNDLHAVAYCSIPTGSATCQSISSIAPSDNRSRGVCPTGSHSELASSIPRVRSLLATRDGDRFQEYHNLYFCYKD